MSWGFSHASNISCYSPSHSSEKLHLRCRSHLMVVLQGSICKSCSFPTFPWETELQLLVWSVTSQWLTGWGANTGHLSGSLWSLTENTSATQEQPIVKWNHRWWSLLRSCILNIGPTSAQILLNVQCSAYISGVCIPWDLTQFWSFRILSGFDSEFLPWRLGFRDFSCDPFSEFPTGAGY